MSAKRILLLSFVVVLIFSSCNLNTVPMNSPAESTDQATATVILSPTFTSVPTMMPTPPLDVSEWIVKDGEQECRLIPYGNEFPGWYMADCPEQLWLPIGQTTTIKVNLLDNETCTINSIDDFEIAIQDISIDAVPVEFVKIEDGGWGCQIPYSDTAGTEVVCVLKVDCEGNGEELRALIFGKTIRVYLKEENGGINGSDDGTGGGSGEEEPPPDFNH